MSLCDLKCLLCKLEMLSDVRITLYRVGEDIILPYEMNENGFEAGRVVRDLPRTTGRRPLRHHTEFDWWEWDSPSPSVVGLPTTPTIPQGGRRNTTLNLNNIKRKEK